MKANRIGRGVLGLVLLLLLSACGGRPDLDTLRKQYDQYPEYSIILQDMRVDGTFFQDYFHRYKVVYREDGGDSENPVFREEVTDWLKVSQEEYEKYDAFLGMTVLAKTEDGTTSDTPAPPGYRYVGDERYGRWRSDSSGNSFWEFYGKFALMQSLFNMGLGGPVYRGDFDDYRRYRGSGRPFFGGRNQYGTGGEVTKRTNPNFFERRQATEARRRASFQDKVKSRARRSNMSGTRSRSGGFGK